ncbi:MAG: hypothetical protein GY708_08410 [Actinomycetia bacterium]|nr:hypothetical protein [Actinomycetes bacterium]
MQFEIAPEFETYTVIHETTEPTNPVANTMRMFAIEDASGLPALFLKDTNGDNTQLGCRSASGNPYDEAAPTEYACRVMTRAADGDCRYLALYDDTDSPAVNAFVWVPIAGVGTSCPLQATP